MKKSFFIAIVAIAVAACNSSNNQKSESAVLPDTVKPVEVPHTKMQVYAPTEGDVRFSDKKVYVYKNGDWVVADDDVVLDNNIVVYRSGKVKKADKVTVLNDGEVITETGDFFDKTGKAIDNAWDATKHGVEDAAKAVKKAAEKVGEKTKDIVEDADKKH